MQCTHEIPRAFGQRVPTYRAKIFVSISYYNIYDYIIKLETQTSYTKMAKSFCT